MKITRKEKILLALLLGAAISTAAHAEGERIENPTGETIEITDETFSDLSGTNGGAVENEGTITGITGSAFENNAADLYGGAVYNEGSIGDISADFTGNNAEYYGGAIYNAGEIETISGSLTSNISSSYGGGAIYNDSKGEILSIEGAEFASNEAERGGAIYNVGTIWNISDSEFSGNKVDFTGGGAIYNRSDIVEISGTTFSGNQANDCEGGAIFNAGSIGIIADSEFASNWVYMDTTDYIAGGGAIHNSGNIDEISGTSFSGNVVYVEDYAAGGAINNEGTIGAISADFDGNYTTNSESTYGGAIYNSGTIESIEGSFTNNYAYGTSGYGGAIYNDAGSTITVITGSTFENNLANAEGGAIYNGGSIGEISADFTENSATLYGGAIYNAGEIEAIAGSFTSNTSDNGGAIYNTSEIGTISGTFTSNTSTNYGGAIYNDSDGDILSIEDAEFASNEAQRGGAIFNAGTIGVISDSAFTENEANFINGGAIYNSGDIVEISGTTFSGNKATDCYGGAIFNNSNGTIGIIEDSEFVGNYVEADEAAGGAIYNTGTIDSIEGYFTDNYATADDEAYGGAIYNTGEIGSITGDFTGNLATADDEAYGGAIYNSGEIDSVEGDFSGNYVVAEEVAAGGAIYNEDSDIGSITGSFTGNYAQGGAESLGGAIYSAAEDFVTIGSITGDFTGNFAGGYDSYGDVASGSVGGGAIYLNSTDVDSIKGDFTGNYAVGIGAALGGAIYADDYGRISTITGDFTGNYVEATLMAEGGALYSEDEIAEIEIEGNFENNHAVSDTMAVGGAIAAHSSLVIKGDLKNNYAEAGASYAYGALGGAICEIDGGVEITGDVIGNHASSEYGLAYGGALLATAVAVEGDVIGNWVETKNGTALGGAIFATEEILGPEEKIATIQGNYAVGGDLAMGGAIYGQATMEVAGNFTDNYVMADGNAYGGAVAALSADDPEQQVILEGDFENNRAISESGDAYGGAVVIYHFGSKSGALSANIEGDFSENSAVAENGTARGGGLYNSDTTEITGDFTGNYVQGLEAYGGAIYNALPEQSEDEDDDEYDSVLLFNGDLTGNHAEAKSTDESDSGNAYGGAVYNESNMAIYAGMEMTDNYATSEAGEAKGGAFYNNGLTLTYVDDDEGYEGYLVFGDVTGNYASGATGAYGGAIYNEDPDTTVVVEGDITNNHATATDGDAMGGAIYSETDVIVEADSITGNYASSTAEEGDAAGGAIFVAPIDEESEGSITVSGDISDNHAISTDGAAVGGAISYEGLVTISAGSLEGNTAESENGAVAGGAIYIGDDGAGSTITVSGDVSGNHVYTAGGDDGDAHGGAISAVSSISSDDDDDDDDDDVDPYSVSTYSAETGITEIAISGKVTENYASGNVAKGGAIYIEGDGEVTIEGDVTGNFVEAVDTAQGGAIYSEGGTITLSGNIKDNYAEGAEAQGGAIYTYGDVNIIADDKDIVISGNYANDEDNAIYIANEDPEIESLSTVSFELKNGGTVTLADNINGDTDYSVDITGDGLDTTFFLLNDLYKADLTIGNTTLNTVDGEARVYKVNSFSVTEDIDMVVDVDLGGVYSDDGQPAMDRFETENPEEGEHDGTLNIAAVNVISDAKGESTEIFFAEEGLKDSVTSSVDTIYSTIYSYDATYEVKDDGGYFTFEKTGFNPAVMANSIAQMGAFNAMGMMFEYNFEHSDYFMKLSDEDRLAMSEAAKRAPKESDPTKAAYYNQNELTQRGVWMRSFASNENVSYRGGYESRDKYYGAMVGFDSKMHVSDNGWANVLTGYAGTLGIRQEFSGCGHIKQHGGFVGVTESFYKKNFYTAWTIAAGTTKAHEHTMYGKDKERLDNYGIAARFGWNFDLGNGKFSLLPTFTASYSYINPEDFTNAADVNISGGFRAVQLNPNLKFIMNTKSGMQPYLTVGEVWTVGDSSDAKANGTKLDELELKPYTEYGVGVQKRWTSGSDAYVQLMGHSHGRDGFLVNAGMRLSF